MNNLVYLFAAYSVIFIVIFVYLLFIGLRQARLEAGLKELERELRAHPDQSAEAGQRVDR